MDIFTKVAESFESQAFMKTIGAKLDFVDEGKVIKTKRGGRRITIKTTGKGKKRSAKVSGKKTKVTINGKKAKRKAIKVGMNCAFHYYGNKTRAKKIICN